MRNLIPHFIHQQFERQNKGGSFYAVALFVDISGFTHLTETLMQYETDGAEVLAGALNRIFAPPVAEVYAHGGFISGFAGDAFTAIFALPSLGNVAARAASPPPSIPPGGREVEQFSPPWGKLEGGDGADVLRHAVHTASAIRDFFEQHGRLETKYGRFDMGVKIGMSLGEVHWGILGDEGRHTYFFRGPAIDGCARAEAQAKSGNVIAGHHIWPHIQAHMDADPLDTIPPYFRLTSSIPAIPPLPGSHTPPALSRQALTPFVQNAVLDLVASGAQAEFRQVAAAFISFEIPRTQRELNAFVSLVMDTTTDYGGYFNKLEFGDKGAVILALWGAPVAYENDLERAANFLLALRERASLRFRAGLSFGTVYAGLVGGIQRCEFTAIGNVVNFASRLMEKADWGQILIPSVAAEAPYLTTEHVGNFHYKGFTEAQPTYRLLSLEMDAESFFDQPMVGRQAELAQLIAAAQPMFDGQCAGVAYIYGEAGIGKSHLAYALHRALREQGDIAWFNAQTDQTLRQAFNPFAYFLKRYFNQAPETTPAANKARFENRLARLITNLEELSPGAPAEQARINEVIHELARTQSMLGALIGLRWPNALYETLDAKLRYQNTLFALKTLLLAESYFHPVVLAIEDLQWLDSASHEALSTLTHDIVPHPLFLVITSRYADDGSKPTLTLAKDVRVSSMDLNVLSPGNLKDLAEVILGGTVDDELLSLLQSRTQANPFFAQQFLYYFRENGWLIQEADTEKWSIKSDIPDDIPTTINAILIARVDRLEQRVKNVVKAAAVLGREFDDRILARMLQADVTPEVHAAEHEQIWSEVR